jgi:4-hydroxy-3-methylbut-2-enyl diphosphate reductase
VRLTEISQNMGTPARLIDDRSELRPEWFAGVGTVLVTAGASAPEDLVQALIVNLVERFGGEVETHDVYHEQVEFGLPGTLKEQMRRRGIDPTGRRVLRKDAHEAMDAWLDRHGIAHRTVDLTVGATR